MKESQHQVAIAIGKVHPDIEAAAQIARACYDAGLNAARVDNTFGDVAEAMMAPLKEAGSWNIHPLVHALNPFGPVGGFGGPGGLDQIPEARRYGRLFALPTVGAELPLAPGMSWSFEPSAVVGGRAAMIPPAAQRAMSERAKATATETPGSYAVFVSRPAAVAAVISQAAQGA